MLCKCVAAYMAITVDLHHVNFPCGKKPEYRKERSTYHSFSSSVDLLYSFHMKTGFELHWAHAALLKWFNWVSPHNITIPMQDKTVYTGFLM